MCATRVGYDNYKDKTRAGSRCGVEVCMGGCLLQVAPVKASFVISFLDAIIKINIKSHFTRWIVGSSLPSYLVLSSTGAFVSVSCISGNN